MSGILQIVARLLHESIILWGGDHREQGRVTQESWVLGPALLKLLYETGRCWATRGQHVSSWWHILCSRCFGFIVTSLWASSMHFGVFTKFHIVLSTSAACVHAQSYPTLGDPMDCSPLSSSVHGISQARMLEWVAISSSRGSSPPRDPTHISCVSCIGRWILYCWATYEAALEVLDSTNCIHGLPEHFEPNLWSAQSSGWDLLSV